MKYFLDTNIIIYALKNPNEALIRHFRSVPARAIAVPSVVLCEIEYGAQKCADYSATIEKYNRFTDAFEMVPCSREAVNAYGLIRAGLEKAGTPIGPNDTMIAAIVLAEGGVLVTNNEREFSRVPGLQIENWTK